MNAANDAWPWRAALAELVRQTRLAQPDELAGEVAAAAGPLARDAWIYLVDQEQRELIAMPRPGAESPPSLPVETTPAGRAFMAVEPVAQPGRLWMPMLDGTERLGVLELVTGGDARFDDEDFLAGCDLFSQLVGHLIATKIPYGDALLKVRRRRRMSEASELVWRLLPPLTFVSRRAVVSAILEPCYEVGGDGFDYAADRSSLFFAIFDTAGHHLRAGLGTAVVLAAVRASRRSDEGLAEMARAADRALEEYLPELRFTTGVLAELNLESGRLRYLNAGHPPPLLLRRGRVVRALAAGRRMPFGVADPHLEIAEDALERGDRLLLYTDGVTEARDRHGEAFGADRLAVLAERETGQLPAPEALRRLCHAALAHYDGPPADDATLMLVEWSAEAVRTMLPVPSAAPD
ncbi:PP2C family protein-serine/threonine phosphatase [Dactylosporangium sp. CA-139066]|uniref:PP2C family protein-serine/threonine phosphatase n=1 Tax=Dactylosporangium sp. CA-139066 TaxID=3239930 RepID=UPI003D8DB99F